MHRYLKHFLIAGLIFGLATPAINWFADPYDIYSSPHIGGFNTKKFAIATNERIYKTLGLAEQKPDVIFLGSSRTDIGLNPIHPAFAGRNAINLGISSQPYEESFKLLNKVDSVKTIVMGVDFFVANAYLNFPADFTDENYSLSRKAKLAVTLSTLRDSIKMARGADQGAGNKWTANGLRLYGDMAKSVGGNREFFLLNTDNYIRNQYLPEPECAFAFASKEGRTPIENIRLIVAKAHREGLDLRLFISPSHAWQWETIAAAGLWNEWEIWKKKLIEINESEAAKAGKAPFPFWDFSGYNSITIETVPPLGDISVFMNNYYDASHYSPEVGNLVLDRIFGFHEPSRKVPDDFGVRISAKNIDDYLARVRSDQLTYRTSHQADISELTSRADKVKSMKHCKMPS